MSNHKFKQIYGKEMLEKAGRIGAITQSEEEIALAVQPTEGDDPFTWADNEAITIIDYYKRKYERDTLYKMSNGKIFTQEELDEIIEKSLERNEAMQSLESVNSMMPELEVPKEGLSENPMGGFVPGVAEVPMQGGNQLPVMEESNTEEATAAPSSDLMTLWYEGEPIRIEERRETKRSKIWHYKIAGEYILEDGEFPSEQLPLVFVDQNSFYDKNGKQICRSFFGDCKDTQRYINYLRTQSAYIIKISRYDQFIGSKKNVAGLDTQRNWADPNNTQGLLAYDESPNGHKPEQLRPPELSQSLLTQYQLAVEDLYTSSGLYPTRLGNDGNEISGKAIDARTRQGSYTTYVFFNSINRAIATGGEVVNEMIPRVYDSERVVTLLTPDEGMKNIVINQQMDEYGESIENDIRKGSYEVRLMPGPSYEGQKQEALMSLQQVLQVDPQAFNLVADLYADNLPLANNIEIKNRLKTLVPPQIIEAGKTGKMPEAENDKPTAEQQAMQLDAQFKEAQIEIKRQELMLKQQETQAEIEIERMKLEIAKMELAGNVEEQRMRYLAETDRTQSDNAIAHADNLVKLMTHKASQQKRDNIYD